MEKIENLVSPRIIKSHLPLYLLHPQLLNTCKVISSCYTWLLSPSGCIPFLNLYNFFVMQVVYVARNVKDVIVSFFYHHRLIKAQHFTGDVNEFADCFMKNLGNKN